MKVSRFNADTNRVRNARLKQTRVRHQIAAINGPPTYLRTSVLTARKQQYVKNMGAIAMESNLVADYEAAVRDAKAVNYNSVTAGYRESFPNDDPPKNSDADMWSRTSLSDAAKAATVSRLWTEAELKVSEMSNQGTVEFKDETEKTNYIAEEYKILVSNKYGDTKRPFSDSTMALSLPEDTVVDPKLSYAMSQLGEITQGIESLEKSLYLYNEEIKTAEQIYYTSRDRASDLSSKIRQYRKELASDELNPSRKEILTWLESEETVAINERTASNNMLVGLRNKAANVRKGISALQQQRLLVANSVGMEIPTTTGSGDFWPNTARYSTGGLLGAAVALGAILYLRSPRSQSTRTGRRKDPVSIFTN